MIRAKQLVQVARTCSAQSHITDHLSASSCQALPTVWQPYASAAAAAAMPSSTLANPWQMWQNSSFQTHLNLTRTFSSVSEAAAQQDKRHALKCNTSAAGSPVSQAIACMVDRDVMPRQQLCDKMDQLSQQLSQEVSAYSSTELAAFSEACRKMGYQHSQAFTAIIQQLAPQASSITADEVSSLLWAASTLSSEPQSPTPASPTTSSSSSSSGGSSSSSRVAGGGSSSSVGKVPQNDGVIGAVNSSRIAGQPELVDFMLGASQVLSADMDDLDSQELPLIAEALEKLEYRDPFLLTVLAETVLERKLELSESELVGLLHSFAAMGRWFFDNRVLDQLTAVLVERASAGKAGHSNVERVAECLAGINHKNKVLMAYMQERSGAAEQ